MEHVNELYYKGSLMEILNQLPFVDGVPEDGQSRLTWIRNGEQLVGADKKYSNEGNANILSVQLQKNIVFLAENFDLLKVNQDLSAADIEKIKEILNDAGTEGLIELVNTNTEQIRLLNIAVEQLKLALEIQDQTIGDITALVGARTENSGSNNVFDDLLFIKTRIGNNAGETINGTPQAGLTASGIILKLDNVTRQAIKNTSDIEDIKTSITESDLPKIHKDLDGIRQELGIKPASGSNTIYVRLKTLEDEDTLINARIDELRSDIGPGKLVTKVNANTTKIASLDDDINGADGVVEQTASIKLAIEAPSTGIEARLNKVTTQSESTTTLVGKTANDGLRKSVADINTTLGVGTTPLPASSVLGRLDLIESEQSDQIAKVQEIEVVLGTSTTGLQGSVLKNTKAIDGDSSATDPVEKAGLMATSKATRNALNDLALVANAVVDKTPYKGKSLAILGDKTSNITNKNVCDKSYILPYQAQVTGLAGVASIMEDNNFSNAKMADLILINVGTYDYLFNTELGTIDDAKAGHTGTPTFYSELYDLLLSVAAGTTRVFITNGYRVVTFADTTVKYPAANASGKKLDDYSKAIEDVANMFSVPVLDTNKRLGINTNNSTQFIGATGFTKIGIERFSVVASNFITSN